MAEENNRSPFALCVVVQTVIFGLGNVITKFAYESVTPLWCMILRFGLALAVFALIFGLRMVRELRGAKLDDWAPTAACLAAGCIACNLALDVTTATNVGFLVALPVVFAPFIVQVVRHVRYPRAMIPFQVAVAGGLYLLCCNSGSFSFGAGVILVAVVGATLVEGRDGNTEAPSSVGVERLVSQLASDSNAR
ncbi:MAG: hypothetical protein DBX43_00660 [Coriobacteriia bacterium]|nr:MAG: hypothetical protein DBX43_00660 [Coriobacteriia bacterium]